MPDRVTGGIDISRLRRTFAAAANRPVSFGQRGDVEHMSSCWMLSSERAAARIVRWLLWRIDVHKFKPFLLLYTPLTTVYKEIIHAMGARHG